MPTTSMNIRLDSDLKREAQSLFSALGLDMSSAVNIFLRQALRQRGLPFEVKLDSPNAETLEALEEVRRMKENPALGKTYTDVDAMMKDLTA
ncbi:MAG: type II toxin-antitoxin system RelB/DinJ family antitoxin [Desulfovibrionaceae bacterium]|nr:type II toxin-antitoxin system RelB/DinJ family antitoxin [Desulfovibrionaceae bacterium]